MIEKITEKYLNLLNLSSIPIFSVTEVLLLKFKKITLKLIN